MFCCRSDEKQDGNTSDDSEAAALAAEQAAEAEAQAAADAEVVAAEKRRKKEEAAFNAKLKRQEQSALKYVPRTCNHVPQQRLPSRCVPCRYHPPQEEWDGEVLVLRQPMLAWVAPGGGRLDCERRFWRVPEPKEAKEAEDIRKLRELAALRPEWEETSSEYVGHRVVSQRHTASCP